MLYSMTGFGRCTALAKDKKITVETKSLNSKQLDLTVRLPQQLRALEGEMRNAAARVLERGKADITVAYEPIGGAAVAELNVEAMRAYKHQLQTIAAELGIPEPADWYAVLLRFPETMHADAMAEAQGDEPAKAMEALDGALAELMTHRRAEGLKLEEFFAKRISRIAELLATVPDMEAERIDRIKTRLTENLEKVAVDYDKARYEQELIYYIEKLDINEEKQRLAQHLAYFTETMQSPEATGKGKKLGFIAQEMGREINTLGSKSNHAEMQKVVVMMKDELEQIKEQVLNVM